MSIRGVDAQIMISRGPDFLKEANAQLKGGEKMQEMLAAREQAETARKRSSVPKAAQAPKTELHLGSEGGGQNAYERAGSRDGPGEVAAVTNALLDADVGPPGNKIDIKL